MSLTTPFGSAPSEVHRATGAQALSADSAVAQPRISVVIPTLNEARNLPHVAARLTADVHEIVLVDGNSVDNTIEVARELWPDVIVVRQTRKGKGNALACGFAATTGDIIVMIDADGSTDPAEIPDYVAPLLAGADYAKGSRFIKGGGSSDITRIRRVGNAGLNGVVNTLFGTSYSDLCYGYNAFWRHCLNDFGIAPGEPGEPVWGDGFEIETLINIRVAMAGRAIVEVPSFEADRIHGESNLNAVRDGLRVAHIIRSERRRIRAERKSARVAARAERRGLGTVDSRT